MVMVMTMMMKVMLVIMTVMIMMTKMMMIIRKAMLIIMKVVMMIIMMVVMIVVVVVVVMVIMMMIVVAAEHQQDLHGKADDQQAGDEGQPRLSLLHDQRITQPNAQSRQNKHHNRMAKRSRAAQQGRLCGRSSGGNHEARHQTLRMSGL